MSGYLKHKRIDLNRRNKIAQKAKSGIVSILELQEFQMLLKMYGYERSIKVDNLIKILTKTSMGRRK